MNELYHHGILGQKWGVRRFQNKDGSYKSGAEGRYNGDGIARKSSKKSSQVSKTGSINNNEKLKTAAKVAAIAAGAALATYGAYKIAEAYQNKQYETASRAGEDFVNKYYLEKRGETSFNDGTKETYYYSPLRQFYQQQENLPDTNSKMHGSNSAYVTAKSKADDIAVSDYNKKVMNKANEITNNTLNNDKYYKTANRIVNIGNKISDKATKEIKNAGIKTKTVARKVGNKVLDTIDPIYQEKEVPGTRTVTTKTYGDGITVRETNWKTQKVKVKRK